MSKPVKIHNEVYERAKSYSEITGVPIIKIIDEALNDWFDSVGEARLEALTKQFNAKVVAISCLN